MRARSAVLASVVAAILSSAACAPAGYHIPAVPAGSRPAPSGTASSGTAPSGTAQARSEPKAAGRNATRGPRPAPARAATPPDLDFTALTVDGTTFRGTALLGRPSVLWFWVPGCPVCRAQVPEVLEVRRRFAGKVNVLGVAGLDRTTTITAFVTDRGIGVFPQLSDSSGAVWRRFDVTQQGTYVLIDAAGTVRHSGPVRSGDLAARIARLGR
jgi:peroxiredoxin